MITVLEAKKIADRVSGTSNKKVCDYADLYYLFINDTSTPFFIVNKHDGSVRFLNPMENFDEFSNAIENKVIRSF